MVNVGKGKQKVNKVSEQERWMFIGILISAGPQGKGGSKLWEKESRREGRGMTKPINYGPDGENIMAFHRFKEIKAAFPWSFQDQRREKDPWNMILLMVDGFNANRHRWVAASVRKVLDETMSAWQPQTSKAGNLLILRKPEPLGTEFKTIACTVTGTCMHVVARFAVKKRQCELFLIASCGCWLCDDAVYSSSTTKQSVNCSRIKKIEKIEFLNILVQDLCRILRGIQQSQGGVHGKSMVCVAEKMRA
jgi:hypothetical protein